MAMREGQMVTTFLEGAADPDFVMISLRSTQQGTPIGQRTIEVGMYVNPEVFDSVDGIIERIKAGLRRARTDAAVKKGIPVDRVTWDEEWHRGPWDMSRQLMEDQPFQRLDWS